MGQGLNFKNEQARIDGQSIKAEQDEAGIMGVKAKIKDQIQKHVGKEGRLLMHWKRQSSGTNYPFIFPLWLSMALQVDLEKVCEVICEMIDQRDVVAVGNLPRPMVATVLVEHCKQWDAVNRNPAKAGKVEGRLALLPPFAQATGANINTQAKAQALLL